MAFTISGAKYSALALTAVGTTDVTIGVATFVSGDFASQRLVGLWNSAGTTFKGMAWVRRFVSTTQLELETEIFDPATGIVVTQVVGDLLQVSKNFSESVVAGLAVSGKTVTLTDQPTFGTSSSNSVCFFDQAKELVTNNTLRFLGGLTVFGKLESYANNTVSSPIDIYSTVASSNPLIQTRGTEANFCMYGGAITGSAAIQFIGGHGTGGAAGNTLIFNSVQNSFDFLAPNSGGTWGAKAARHQLVNCFSQSTSTNTILVRWSDGVIRGGSYKFPGFTNAPLSVFGSDVAGTYFVSASPGERLIVLDMGDGNSLVRSSLDTTVITFEFTNLISTDITFMAGTAAINNNGTIKLSYSDSFTNIQAGSVGVVLDSSSALAASETIAGSVWSPVLLRRTSVGSTITVNSTSWTWGLKKYGYGALGGSITPSTYSLGSAGNPDNVVFGGSLLQIADPAVTLSEAAALALSSKITAATGSPGTITITANATIDEIYDYLVAWGSSSVTLAQLPALDEYPASVSGSALETDMNLVVNTGVTLSSGAKLNRFNTTGSVTISGAGVVNSIYESSAGVSARLEISGLATNAAVYVENASGAQQDYQIVSGGSYSLNIAPGATGVWRWVAKLQGYEHVTATFSPGAGGLTSISVSLSQKLLPDGSAMYQASTSAICAVSFSGLTNAYIDIGDGSVSLQNAFDETETALVTASGMAWLASGKSDTAQFNSAAGDFFFLSAGWRLRRALAGDANATIQAFVQSADGTPVDEINGPVRFLSSDSPTAIAAAVISQMNATPPSVNVDSINGAGLAGDGTLGDPWRGIGVLP